MGPDERIARSWARWYRRDLGLNPLPSVPDLKIPSFEKVCEVRDGGISDRDIERFWRPNLQVATGRRWGLVVVDLDGPIALDQWKRVAAENGCPATWVVRSRRGYHMWFSVPREGEEFPHKAVIWEIPGVKHAAIEVLGDRNLAMAPPSFHAGTSGPRYRFLPGRSPRDLPAPAPLPDWLAERASRRREDAQVPHLPPLRMEPRRPVAVGPGYAKSDVLAAIPDKTAVACGWGLRVVDRRVNAAGWMTCRSWYRDDSKPSARFSPATGRYWEVEHGRLPISLFDLGSLIGGYADWVACCNDLGHQFLASEVKRAG